MESSSALMALVDAGSPHAERLGGAGEAAVVDNGDENLELLDGIHERSLRLRGKISFTPI